MRDDNREWVYYKCVMWWTIIETAATLLPLRLLLLKMWRRLASLRVWAWVWYMVAWCECKCVCESCVCVCVGRSSVYRVCVVELEACVGLCSVRASEHGRSGEFNVRAHVRTPHTCTHAVHVNVNANVRRRLGSRVREHAC